MNLEQVLNSMPEKELQEITTRAIALGREAEVLSKERRKTLKEQWEEEAAVARDEADRYLAMLPDDIHRGSDAYIAAQYAVATYLAMSKKASAVTIDDE